jgi:hypothetical protein
MNAVIKRMRAGATVLANIDARRAVEHDENICRNVEQNIINATLAELETLSAMAELRDLDAEMEAFAL